MEVRFSDYSLIYVYEGEGGLNKYPKSSAKMKANKVNLLLAIIMMTGCSTSTLPDKHIIALVDSVVYKWVPDQRENLCKVDIGMSSGKEIIISGETNLPEAKEDILMSLSNAGIKYVDSLSILPHPSVAEKPWGLVSVSISNIKKEPSYSSEMTSQAVMGTPVKILKRDDNWVLVQTPDHYLGWVNGSGITEMNEHDFNAWQKSERAIYTSKSGDIAALGGSVGIVSDIVAGSLVEVIGTKGNSFIVKLPDGREGLINKTDARDFRSWCQDIVTEPQKLISFAVSMNGYPYLWGGTSVKAADCSGFVRTVYFNCGTILARDASLQYLHGKPVNVLSSLDSLSKGDLVFFGYINKNGEKRIIHVGMYIGDTEVIHSSGMVGINSLDSSRGNYSSYLGTTLMGARRIIGTASGKGNERIADNSWYNYFE